MYVMPNKNYIRSRNREYATVKELEKEGYLAFRSAGSHTFSDITAIKPFTEGNFEVRFIQIKVSENRISEERSITTVKTPIGVMEVELWKFPIKAAKYRAKMKKRKLRKSSPPRT